MQGPFFVTIQQMAHLLRFFTRIYTSMIDEQNICDGKRRGGEPWHPPTQLTEDLIWRGNTKTLCKLCIKARGDLYYKKNGEQCKARVRKYRADNPDKVRALNDKYYTEHGERLREQNNARNRKRYATDERYRSMAKAHSSLRREDMRVGIEEHWGSWEGLMEWVDAQPKNCHYCEAPFEGLEYEFEHMTPVVKGGRFEPSNITLACRSCNAAKGDKSYAEFKLVRD